MKNTVTLSAASSLLIKAAAFLLIAALVTAALLWSRTAEFSPGVLKTPLPARCQFLHFTLRSKQPERTFVVACPGHEYFRLWPLPAGTWNEEPWPSRWQEM